MDTIFDRRDEEANLGFSRAASLGKRPETNPVSHQTQVIAESQRAAAGPMSLSSVPLARSPPAAPGLLGGGARTKLEVREATPAEKKHMLGEDEDESEEEDDDEDEESEEEATPKKPSTAGKQPLI